MNKKAQSVWFSVLIAIVIFVAGMLIVNFLKTPIDNARTDLVCSAPASDGVKVTCILIDITMSYWFIAVLSLVIGTLSERFLI